MSNYNLISRPLVLILLMLLSTSCANVMLMDNARSIPQGNFRLTMTGAAGYQTGTLVSFDAVTLEARPGREKLPPIRVRSESGYLPEWTLGGRLGLGAGLQMDGWVGSPLPVSGASGGLGLKLQLSGFDRSLFSSALSLRTTLTGLEEKAVGTQGMLWLISLAAGPVFGIDPSEAFGVYFSPRLIYNRIMTSWKDAELTGYADAEIYSLGLSLGWTIYELLYFEGTGIISPDQPGADGGDLRLMFGLGLAIPIFG